MKVTITPNSTLSDCFVLLHLLRSSTTFPKIENRYFVHEINNWTNKINVWLLNVLHYFMPLLFLSTIHQHSLVIINDVKLSNNHIPHMIKGVKTNFPKEFFYYNYKILDQINLLYSFLLDDSKFEKKLSVIKYNLNNVFIWFVHINHLKLGSLFIYLIALSNFFPCTRYQEMYPNTEARKKLTHIFCTMRSGVVVLKSSPELRKCHKRKCLKLQDILVVPFMVQNPSDA